MKTIDHVSLAATIAALVLAAFAALVRLDADPLPAADYADGENSAELVTPEAIAALGMLVGPQHANALAHALRLNMGLYDGDMRTQTGRRHWHGVLIGEEVYTNSLCKIEVYSNKVTGAIWRFRTPFRPKEPKTPKPPSLGKDGIPARLAAARARRNAELTGPKAVTNLVIEANR